MKIGFSVKFNKAKYPSKKKLIGKYCFLEPVNAKKHAKDLYKNFSLDKKGIDWTYMPTGPYKTFSSFKKYLTTDKLSGNPFFYSIYSKKLKTYCGLASYLRIKPEIGTIEVGWITYAKNLQRTVEATEAMYLMMKNVFENLGYRRYEWKCDSLNKKSLEFNEIVKIGRTHLMDATPITLGQEFSGYVSQIDHGINTIENAIDHLSELPIGGTAVGTGLNTPKGYSSKIVEYISKNSEMSFKESLNKFEGIATHDCIVEMHGALKTVAASVYKISNDI